jgi:two-component system, OmpR family, phosphate regulon sensor histidine kinase PhoR
MAPDDAGGRQGSGWLGRLLRSPDLSEQAVPPARGGGELAGPPHHAALLDAVVSGMPDPVVLLDQDGRVLSFNAGAVALAPALRRGEPASIALRMPELVEAIRAAIATGKAQRIEFSARVPSARWSEAFVAPVAFARGDGGRAGIVVITVHDLTPVRQVDEMRADFVANVSHELRTPLAALTGFIDTLQGPARDDPEARSRFLDIMQAQAWRMARLIDDLLSLSRIELRAHQRPGTPVDLVPIVRQVVDGLQMLARDRGVAIEVAAPAEPLVVLGDRDELIRVFENLVENGLKYGASGKHVEITLERATAPDGRPEARVCVRDHGPGISAEHLPRLTERFYRVDVGESRAQGGTGLGLALVKHILNRHQGRLSIESKPGEGAAFTIRLGLAEQPPAQVIP